MTDQEKAELRGLAAQLVTAKMAGDLWLEARLIDEVVTGDLTRTGCVVAVLVNIIDAAIRSYAEHEGEDGIDVWQRWAAVIALHA